MRTPVAEPAALSRQSQQTRAKRTVVSSLRSVAVDLRRDAPEPAGPPLRVVLLFDRPAHGRLTRGGRQKFFRSISFEVALSITSSASSFFSWRFSSSREHPPQSSHPDRKPNPSHDLRMKTLPAARGDQWPLRDQRSITQDHTTLYCNFYMTSRNLPAITQVNPDQPSSACCLNFIPEATSVILRNECVSSQYPAASWH
jgi:hypothetical protein